MILTAPFSARAHRNWLRKTSLLLIEILDVPLIVSKSFMSLSSIPKLIRFYTSPQVDSALLSPLIFINLVREEFSLYFLIILILWYSILSLT